MIGRYWRAGLLSAAACGLVVLCGCEEGERRYAVSGTLKIDDQPIDDATIVFTPIGAGLSGAAVVKEGAFTCSPQGGPSKGRFHVRISPNEAELEEVQEDADAMAPTRKPKVPPRFQQVGNLEVEITGEEDQVLDLDLKS